MADLSNMYQRVGNHINLENRKPLNFAVLVLPPAAQLRAKGLTDYPTQWGTTRDHLYGKWEKHEFIKGWTTEQALAKVEAVNRSNPRIVKIRINFTDGTFINLSRKKPSDPNSLKSTGMYDPNEVFHKVTEPQCELERTHMQKKMKYLCDDRGHLKQKLPGTVSHFAREKLFSDCPKPCFSKPGYAFTPVSYNSFMVRPNYKIPGCRPHITDFSETAINFRPRGFNTETFINNDEIDARNQIDKNRMARAGEDVYTGVFMRSASNPTGKKGAPLSPLRERNSAASGLRTTLDATGKRVVLDSYINNNNDNNNNDNTNNNNIDGGDNNNNNQQKRTASAPHKRDNMNKYYLKGNSAVGGGRGVLVGRMRPLQNGYNNVIAALNNNNNSNNNNAPHPPPGMIPVGSPYSHQQRGGSANNINNNYNNNNYPEATQFAPIKGAPRGQGHEDYNGSEGGSHGEDYTTFVSEGTQVPVPGAGFA